MLIIGGILGGLVGVFIVKKLTSEGISSGQRAAAGVGALLVLVGAFFMVQKLQVQDFERGFMKSCVDACSKKREKCEDYCGCALQVVYDGRKKSKVVSIYSAARGNMETLPQEERDLLNGAADRCD